MKINNYYGDIICSLAAEMVPSYLVNVELRLPYLANSLL